MYALLCCNDRRPSAAGRSCSHKIYHEHSEAVEPATAEAITLKPAASKPAELTLADVVPGQHAVVSSLLSGGDMRRRLLDIGLTPGTQVKCIGQSPLGDPSAFLIRGAVIALRRKDCRDILITGDGQNNSSRSLSPGYREHIDRNHASEAVSWD